MHPRDISLIGYFVFIGLDDRGVTVRVPTGSRYLLCIVQLGSWEPIDLLLSGYLGSFPGGKVAGSCS
jgi:hypothetical protein